MSRVSQAPRSSMKMRLCAFVAFFLLSLCWTARSFEHWAWETWEGFDKEMSQVRFILCSSFRSTPTSDGCFTFFFASAKCGCHKQWMWHPIMRSVQGFNLGCANIPRRYILFYSLVLTFHFDMIIVILIYLIIIYWWSHSWAVVSQQFLQRNAGKQELGTSCADFYHRARNSTELWKVRWRGAGAGGGSSGCRVVLLSLLLLPFPYLFEMKQGMLNTLVSCRECNLHTTQHVWGSLTTVLCHVGSASRWDCATSSNFAFAFSVNQPQGLCSFLLGDTTLLLHEENWSSSPSSAGLLVEWARETRTQTLTFRKWV